MNRQTKIRKLGELYEEIARDSRFLYVVFTDLCDSTEYKQWLLDNEIGDSVWIHRQLIFLNEVGHKILKAGGTVVKTIGDSVMATFDYSASPKDIICTYIDISITFRKLKAFKGRHKILMKTSLDYGEVNNGAILGRNFDPIGICVDRCARLNSSTQANQISFSSEFDKKLRTADKRTIHTSIQDHQVHEENFKGIGKTKYFKLQI